MLADLPGATNKTPAAQKQCSSSLQSIEQKEIYAWFSQTQYSSRMTWESDGVGQGSVIHRRTEVSRKDDSHC